MGIQKFPNPKDESDDLDYSLNWATTLPAGDTIVASVWVVPAGLTSHDEDFTTTTTTIWLAGGTVDTSYQLTNTVTTAAGRVISRDVILSVKNL